MWHGMVHKVAIVLPAWVSVITCEKMRVRKIIPISKVCVCQSLRLQNGRVKTKIGYMRDPRPWIVSSINSYVNGSYVHLPCLIYMVIFISRQIYGMHTKFYLKIMFYLFLSQRPRLDSTVKIDSEEFVSFTARRRPCRWSSTLWPMV